MIHYTLVCSQAHEFDGWFASSAAFDAQAERGLVECPVCADKQVTRGLMTPSVPAKSNTRAAGVVQKVEPQADQEQPARSVAVSGREMPDQVRAALQKLRAEIERHADYVGEDFAEEALRQHRGEADRRAIYGEASDEQAEALLEEGVQVARIPWVSRADS
jgi:hypothetical protein